MLANRYGHFTDEGRTFRITDPLTPMPWVNVVCNGRYGFVVSQNGGGFSWLDNSQLNVLTRWDMDLARDAYGKFLYVADLDDAAVWSLAPTPARPAYDEFTCDHSPGMSVFRSLCRGIRATWTMAVAPGDNVELWSVELTNTSDRVRRLRIASYFEWCCGVAPDVKREFHRLFITTAHDAKRQGISAVKNMWDVPARDEREHWNRPWPYGAMHAVGGATFEQALAIADKATFLGRAGNIAHPEAMTASNPGTSGANPGGFGRFGDGIAALGGDLTLKPGQTVRIHYLLTIGNTVDEAAALVDKYNDANVVQSTINAAKAAWHDRLTKSSIRSSSHDFDLLNNTWLPYQAISGRIWGRTGYYQQSGAYGFRDQLQDSQVWLPIDPNRTREQLLLHARHQFADGSVYHWWHPLTETGLRTACSDDYLWLPFVAINYIKETGDLAILNEQAPFVDDAKATSLLDHCRRSFARAFARFSPRGLPLIGSCDWNDGLSALGVQGRGESTWLAFFLIQILGDFAALLERADDDAMAADYRARRDALVKAVNQHAWDGEWFKRATKDDGTWIGTSKCTDGRIYLNAQTWAILTDAADPSRLDAAWTSVQKHLLGPMGPLLLAPAYTTPDPTVGYITRYAPGLRENGGVYMHAATWALMAACKRKDAESVGRIWRSVSPPTRCADADAYRAEPYVVPGNVDGPRSEFPGRAGWTWYTGSAAWLNLVSLEWVLGIRPVWDTKGDGLLIDPCPFKGLGEVDVTRTWRGRAIRVRFDARAFTPGARAVVHADGRVVPDGIIRPGTGPVDVQVGWSVAGAGLGGAGVEESSSAGTGPRAGKAVMETKGSMRTERVVS